MVSTHVCAESKTCTCWSLALEPDERCPIHGAGTWPPRCGTCGKFLSWNTRDFLAQGATNG